MNIIKNKKVLKGLGQQIDLLNTLNGGVSMITVKVAEKKDRMVVAVTAPGLAPESMHVGVEFNKLILYGGFSQSSEAGTVAVPLFSRIISIPFQVNVDEIRAIYKNGKLEVIMPYAEGRLSRRQIEIEQL